MGLRLKYTRAPSAEIMVINRDEVLSNQYMIKTLQKLKLSTQFVTLTTKQIKRILITVRNS
jgi:hypothetical protein